MQQVRSKATAIGITTAGFINTEDLLSSQGNENSPAFLKIHDALLKVRDENRQQNIALKYIYIIRPDPHHQDSMVFLVDAHPNPRHRSHPGEHYFEAADIGILQHLDEVYAPDHLITDRWGSWLSVFVPIWNPQGEYVATLGLDLSASEIHIRIARLGKFALIALSISLLIAILLAFILSRRAAHSLYTLCAAVEKITQGDLDVEITLDSKDEFQDLASAIRSMCKGLQERERLKGGFARYVSKGVFDILLTKGLSGQLSSEKRKVTILFSDIRQFTRLAETLDPHETVSILNEYFSAMIDIVFSYNGTLDKFIGDGMMVEFGAPLEDPEQETNAIRAALAMQKKVKELGDKWESEGKPRLHIGIGIHTGYVVMGTMGSEKRMEYTAIGDNVNIASRLEQATKTYKVPILVSETTFAGAQNVFQATKLGPITLPGRTEEIIAYAVESEKT